MTDEEDEQPAGRRIGRTMIWIAWIAVLALLTVPFSRYLEQRDNPNIHPDSRRLDEGVYEVVLTRNRAGHYVARGEINEVQATFLLDTGATNVAIPEDLAERTGVKRGRVVSVQTANGVVQAWLTRLDTVKLGGIVLHDVRATINPQMSGDSVLLGMTFLKRLEMVQRGKTLTLRQYPR